jgi:hypothetical protein
LQHYVASIVEQLPSIATDTTLLIVESTPRNSPDYINTISAFLGLVYEYPIHMATCTLVENETDTVCVFGADDIQLRSTSNNIIARLDYAKLIVLESQRDKNRTQLLATIPPSFLSDTIQVEAYDPFALIDTSAPYPDRVNKIFTCWPVEQCIFDIPVENYTFE